MDDMNMNFSIPSKYHTVIIGVIVLIMIGLGLILWNIGMSTDIGKEDFIGYWSAAYLFRNDQNPYDPELMLTTQNELVPTTWDYPIMSWNPPTLIALLAPLGFLSFSAAKSIWLIVNIVLVLAASLILARLYLPEGHLKSQFVFLLFAVSFPQVLLGIQMGQITFLVYFGLVASVALIKKEQWFWAGAVLILTSIKPHMVLLSLIYLLFYMVKHRQFKGWIGLGAAGLFSALVLFIFRPAWISDYIGLFAIAPTNWATPTIGGLLSYLQITELAKSLIFLFLPLPFILLKYSQKVSIEFAIALLTLITVPTTFFGWSYDQTLLLIPIALVFRWVFLSNKKILTLWIPIIILFSLILNYYLRTVIANDAYYLWIPILWWILFGFGWRSFSSVNPIKSS